MRIASTPGSFPSLILWIPTPDRLSVGERGQGEMGVVNYCRGPRQPQRSIITPSSNGKTCEGAICSTISTWSGQTRQPHAWPSLATASPPFSPRRSLSALTSLSFRKKSVSETKTKQKKQNRQRKLSLAGLSLPRGPIMAAMASTSRNDGGMPPPRNLTNPKTTCLLPEPCCSSSRPAVVGSRLLTTPTERAKRRSPRPDPTCIVFFPPLHSMRRISPSQLHTTNGTPIP